MAASFCNLWTTQGELAVLMYGDLCRRLPGFPGLRRERSAAAYTDCDLAFLTVDGIQALRRESDAIDASLTAFVDDLLLRKPGLLAQNLPAGHMAELRALFDSHVPAMKPGDQGEPSLDSAMVRQLLTKLRAIGFLPEAEDAKGDGGVDDEIFPEGGITWEAFCREFVPAEEEGIESSAGPSAFPPYDSGGDRLGAVEGRLGRLELHMGKISNQLDLLLQQTAPSDGES